MASPRSEAMPWFGSSILLIVNILPILLPDPFSERSFLSDLPGVQSEVQRVGAGKGDHS